MEALPSQPDVVIVGAGAAGIGAGRALKSLGLPAVVVEARGRVGGRAYTDRTSLGVAWDQGCHWFHTADRNLLRVEADRLGHQYLSDPVPPVIGLFSAGQWAFDGKMRQRIWDALDHVASSGQDVAASSLLDATDPLMPLIRHWFALMTSREIEQISALDMGRYDDSHVNFPVSEGYGALVEKLAQGLPIVSNVTVEKIARDDGGVTVTTNRGAIRAKACILAVPARLLAEGHIRIEPEMPHGLRQAFEGVPMGHYEKVALLFREPPVLPDAATYIDVFEPPVAETMPLNFEISPFGRPIAIAHLAGDQAADLGRAGRDAMIDFTIETLAKALGGDIRSRIIGAVATEWGANPFTLGGYSCAMLGRADLRHRFQEPLHERIFLAGEYASEHSFATCHGAYATGIRAAENAARLLGHPV